jgi:hypothetical protein
VEDTCVRDGSGFIRQEKPPKDLSYRHERNKEKEEIRRGMKVLNK